MLRRFAAAFAVLIGLVCANPVWAGPVLLISVDGLRPGDVLEADKRGLKVPTLRRFVREGAYASGVRGVLPTVTYPSHATLLTGVSPARHGIVGNTTFDPLQINAGGWFWFAQDFKVPTLWQAASGAGLSVGNLHWPVSVGAAGINWNLPQVWRTGHGDDAKLLAALATPGLLAHLEQARGEPYAQGIIEDIDGDENRARFAVSLIEARAPEFLTVYYTAYDHQQHIDGPGTAGAHAVLERIDSALAQVIAAELKAHPDAVIALVSDHGFAPVMRVTNLFRAFIDAGLIVVGPDGKVKSWEAMPWPSGGSAAIVLARPNHPALKALVAAKLAALQSEPESGIAGIADAAEIKGMGGNPDASFYVNFKLGTSAGSFADQAKGLYAVPKNKGTHGWFPGSPELRASFMIMGPGIPKGRNLGEIDQRAIAPTLARIMGASMPMAEVPGLSF
ncbi:MAG: ectonucleotide pyrophosphatase/phosphodiesterase [Novosphingobium sp.]|uniref:alkaline phosphatase family protein n=1 Tax=Novosphingobium sp. TaxID=1874826 RepID=UPI0032BAFF91